MLSSRVGVGRVALLGRERPRKSCDLRRERWGKLQLCHHRREARPNQRVSRGIDDDVYGPDYTGDDDPSERQLSSDPAAKQRTVNALLKARGARAQHRRDDCPRRLCTRTYHRYGGRRGRVRLYERRCGSRDCRLGGSNFESTLLDDHRSFPTPVGAAARYDDKGP